MLKTLVIVVGLVAGLSACMGPYGDNGYGYNGYGNSGYSNAGFGYNRPAYYGYGYNTPVYYGGGYNGYRY
jgi:hypothetical protein